MRNMFQTLDSSFCKGVVLRNVETCCFFFMAYLHGPSFKGDMTESLCDYDMLASFFNSGFNLRLLSSVYCNLLAQRVLYRLAESVVSAACLVRGDGFGKATVLHHYVYPIIQEYRFTSFTTHFMWKVASWIVPRWLRGCLRLNSPCLSTNSSHSVQTPSAPTSLWYAKEIPENIQLSCPDAVKLFDEVYKEQPARTILSTGFIPDLSRLLVSQCLWGLVYYKELNYNTSRWRVLKPHLRYLFSTGVETFLSYSVRAAGALLGKRYSQGSDSGVMFWSEHLLYLLCFIPISFTGQLAGEVVGRLLERAFPPSATDMEQDAKEREEEAESMTRRGSWLRMFEEAGFGYSKESVNGDGKPSSNGYSAKDGPESSAGFEQRVANNGSLPDFYAVLGVPENAPEHQIKKAYHKLALQYHPDRAGTTAVAQHEAREHMALINDAYDTLSDNKKREEYNRVRHMTPMFQYVDKLESMTMLHLVMMGIGIITLMGTVIYVQLRAAFYHLTSPGCVPLIFHQ